MPPPKAPPLYKHTVHDTSLGHCRRIHTTQAYNEHNFATRSIATDFAGEASTCLGSGATLSVAGRFTGDAVVITIDANDVIVDRA